MTGSLLDFPEILSLSCSGQELSSLSNNWERKTCSHLTWSLLMMSLPLNPLRTGRGREAQSPGSVVTKMLNFVLKIPDDLISEVISSEIKIIFLKTHGSNVWILEVLNLTLNFTVLSRELIHLESDQ